MSTLNEFFDRLDAYDATIPLDELKRHLADLELDEDALAAFEQFDDAGYQRNLVHGATHYQALLLCWKSGQRSAIHDHHATNCGVRVVRGTATETIFARNAEGWIFPTGTFERPPGGVCGSADTDIHQLSNLQADGAPLVTLHIYSPPLAENGVYSIEDNSVRSVVNPVNADGARATEPVSVT